MCSHVFLQTTFIFLCFLLRVLRRRLHRQFRVNVIVVIIFSISYVMVYPFWCGDGRTNLFFYHYSTASDPPSGSRTGSLEDKDSKSSRVSTTFHVDLIAEGGAIFTESQS